MRIKKSIIMLLIVALILIACLSFNYFNNLKKMYLIESKNGLAADYIKHHINPNMTIISHRGASGEVVEHTFEAYDKAINEGNNLIEQDVQTSKDGTLWVSHDESSERITGVKKNYSDMNDNEISKLHTENGENIHTLEEVLERYGIDNNIIFVIELKNGSSQVDNFLSLLRKYDVVNRTIVQSFEYEGIESAIKKQPDLVSMFLAENISNIEKHLPQNTIDIICFDKTLLSKGTVRKIKYNGKLPYLYTLDTDDEFNKAKEYGGGWIFY